MSEKLCTLRTKGGGGGAKYTETSLWTNPSPSSSFSGQTVTLSDSVSNYKYIAIKSGFNNSYYSDSESMTIVVPVDELKKATDNTSVRHSALSLCGRYANSYTRTFFYTSDTTISFSSCYQYASSTQTNGNCIPLEILGLNELATGHRLRETILWTNSAPTSSFSGQKVTLSESLSNYDMVRLYWRKTKSDSSEMYIDVRVSDYTSITANTGSFQLYMGYRHTNGGCGRSVSGSGTTAGFGNCYFFASTTAANNANVIPTKVAGLRIS